MSEADDYFLGNVFYRNGKQNTPGDVHLMFINTSLYDINIGCGFTLPLTEYTSELYNKFHNLISGIYN